MKRNEIEVGEKYIANVSGERVTVKILRELPSSWGGERSGGWEAVNERTGRMVRIRIAGRLHPLPSKILPSGSWVVCNRCGRATNVFDGRMASHANIGETPQTCSGSFSTDFSQKSGSTPVKAITEVTPNPKPPDPDTRGLLALAKHREGEAQYDRPHPLLTGPQSPPPPVPAYYRVSLEVLSSAPVEEIREAIEQAIDEANQDKFRLTKAEIIIEPRIGG